MQIEGILHHSPRPCLELTSAVSLPDSPLIIMIGSQLFRDKLCHGDHGWFLPLPAVMEGEEGQRMEAWVCPEDPQALMNLTLALKEALLANRSAFYFYLLLEAEQRQRLIDYVEEGNENDRIRRIDKVIAMLYEHRTL